MPSPNPSLAPVPSMYPSSRPSSSPSTQPSSVPTCGVGKSHLLSDGGSGCNFCPIGTYVSELGGICYPCPLGSYNPNIGSSTCLQCKYPEYTQSDRQTSSGDCKAICLCFDLKT